MVTRQKQGLQPKASWALTGKVGDTHVRFVLPSGVSTVGRGRENDVVLEVPGVSERHAVLEVSPEGIEIRDLASKNGTFCAGERISSARVEPGADVQFGPASMQIAAIDPDDAWLSVTARKADSESTTVSGKRLTSTVGWQMSTASDDSRRWLELLDELTHELGVGSAARLGRALTVLARATGAKTAALLSQPEEGSPIVLASHGHLTEIVPLATFREARAQARAEGRPQLRQGGDEAMPWVVAVDSDPDALSLMLAGLKRVSRDERRLLRIGLRILGQAAGRDAGSVSPAAARENELRFPDDYVVGESPAMEAVYRQLRSVAASDLPLLLIGETGVGKECLAQTVHLSSNRRGGPFLPINCAAIPSELLEAELFGIAKGVATGVAERQGRFSAAEGGTLFLDEIGDMSKELQAKLLRALEEGRVQPVGGAAVEVDVRLIAATNTDLAGKVESGEFRRDLYYRLAGLVVTIPALRRRQKDLAALIEHFFHQAVEESGRPISGLTYGAMRRLSSGRWPGNVRELRHAVRQLVLLCPRGQAIDSAMVFRLENDALEKSSSQGSGEDFSSWESLDLKATSKGLIGEAMRRTGGNQTAAAVLLGITRSALRRRLRKLADNGSGRPD